MLAQTGGLPDTVVACVGGGSNAMGVFAGFDDPDVELVGVEAAVRCDTERHWHHFRGNAGRTRVPEPSAGRRRPVHPAHSISAGLDYPGVGPEHAYLKDSGRATYVAVTDDEALSGFALLSRLEGIIPALETAHAVAWIDGQKGRWSPDQRVLLCVSGRGDKDVAQISQLSTLPE
jgi:tryptophan synthase beta chain